VCASCTYQTVQAAIDAASDGDVIAIGKGTYVEDLTIANTDLTLRACPGDRVTLRNATRDAAGLGQRTIAVTGGKSLTVLDITVDGYQDWENSLYGGGIGSDGSVTLAGTTVVKNGGWKDNAVVGVGGALAVIGDGLTVTVTDDAVVRDNAATLSGGGIYVEGASDLVISGWAVIADNIAGVTGGGVLTNGAGVNVTVSGHARITGNTQSGIAIQQWNGGTRAVTVIIEGDVVIAENSVAGMGGGIYAKGVTGAAVTVLIRDRVQIIGNAAMDFGGGVAFEDWATATISGEVEISGNTAFGSNGYGGGMFVSWFGSGRPADWVQLTITDSAQVSDNTAAKTAGGIYVSETEAAVEGSAVISGNTCEDGYGGGVYLESGGNPAAMTVRGAARITGNTASSDGGGIYADNSELAVEGSAVISGNTAVKGGGVAIYNPAAVTVSGSATITGNTATASAPSGGGVWAESNTATLTAVTGSITGNTPDQCAGGTISC
jgi:predicted outer membrane repeat protein